MDEDDEHADVQTEQQQQPPSQASSHFPLLPVSGATLYDMEVARRDALRRKGSFVTGCDEIDGRVLMGGFERGCVVGVSAEESESRMGLLIGLQTIAHYLVHDEEANGRKKRRRASVITTLREAEVATLLRDVVRSQVNAKVGGGGPGNNHLQTRDHVLQCLERVSISRVFDIEGLWEVLRELEMSSPPTGEHEEDNVHQDTEPQPEPEPAPEPPESAQRPTSPPVTRLPPLRIRTEVLDSEDEGGLLSSESSQPASSPIVVAAPAPTSPSTQEHVPDPPSDLGSHLEEEQEEERTDPDVPEIILITHFSALLQALFTSRDKTSAHTYLQLLSSHLKHLSRSAGPLIMLLNNTTSPYSISTTSNNNKNNAAPTTPGGPSVIKTPAQRPLEPTLRSIFNPAPPPPNAGTGNPHYSAAGHLLSRKNKPAFGQIFAQFLDLHLLCTRLPRSRGDAELLFAPDVAMPGGNGVRYVWVVEVLLDEGGVWDIDTKTAGAEKGECWRREDSREQRWGAVDVQDGMRVVDAFKKETAARRDAGPIRLAAGFGGPRV